jgi:hypothetical protein
VGPQGACRAGGGRDISSDERHLPGSPTRERGTGCGFRGERDLRGERTPSLTRRSTRNQGLGRNGDAYTGVYLHRKETRPRRERATNLWRTSPHSPADVRADAPLVRPSPGRGSTSTGPARKGSRVGQAKRRCERSARGGGASGAVPSMSTRSDSGDASRRGFIAGAKRDPCSANQLTTTAGPDQSRPWHFCSNCGITGNSSGALWLTLQQPPVRSEAVSRSEARRTNSGSSTLCLCAHATFWRFVKQQQRFQH